MKKNSTRSTFLPPEDVPTFGNRRRRRRTRRSRGSQARSGVASGAARILFAGAALKLLLPVFVMAVAAVVLWSYTPAFVQTALLKLLFAG